MDKQQFSSSTTPLTINALPSPSSSPSPPSTTQTSTPSKFTLFPLLPTELRLQIWKQYHLLTPPQILSLKLCPVDIDHRTYRRKQCFIHPHILIQKQASIPSILHTCSESRDLGLRYYKSTFDIQNPRRGTPCTHQLSYSSSSSIFHSSNSDIGEEKKGGNLYWNPEKDIIHLELGWLPRELTSYIWGGNQIACFEEIRNLVVDQETLVHVCIESAGFERLNRVFLLGEWGEGDRGVKERDWEFYVGRWDLVVDRERKGGLRVRLVEGLGECVEV